MNTSALAFSSPRRQHGAASLAIVILLVFILAAAVMAVLRISGSSVTDTAMNEAQTSALSLAESGLEKAQATLTLNGYTSAACTGLKGTTSSLGRGTFKYTDAVFSANICTVTVTGTIGNSSRTIRAALSNAPAQGAAGNGSTIPLRLITGVPNAGVITNLAYSGAPAATIGTCTNPANCSDDSSVTNAGATKLTNRSVYESVAASGVYAITQTLVNGGSPAPRNYVQVGAVFSPTSGNSVGFVGAYAANSGDKTAATGGTGSTVPANWNCGGASSDVSAGANTLVYGFSSLAAPGNQMNAVTFGGRTMTKIRDMTGKQGDNLYSQIWVVTNPAYLSGTGTTSGAVVTGYAGTKIPGTIKQNSNVLCLKTIPASISQGTIVKGICPFSKTSSTKTTSSVMTSGSELCGCNGGSWQKSMMMGMTNTYVCKMQSGEEDDGYYSGATYASAILLDKNQTSNTTGDVLVDSDVLTVETASKPYLEVGDTIIGTDVTVGTKIKKLKGTGGTNIYTGTGGTGTYQLDKIQSFDSTDITSNGTTISTSGTAIPTAGQFVDVSTGSATGQFQADTTVLAAPAPTATKYKISKQPTTPLSGAKVCGGVCAFLDNDGISTAFTLANISSDADWSSGFTCLSNVNPSSLGTGEVIDAQRRQWSEVVQ
jgi:hypothetical protein